METEPPTPQMVPVARKRKAQDTKGEFSKAKGTRNPKQALKEKRDWPEYFNDVRFIYIEKFRVTYTSYSYTRSVFN